MIDESIFDKHKSGEHTNGATHFDEKEMDAMPPVVKKPDNWYENFFKMAAFIALIVGVAWWAAITHSTLNQIAKQNEDFKEDARLQKLADQETMNLMIAYLNDVRVKVAGKGLQLADPPKPVTKDDIKRRLGR